MVDKSNPIPFHKLRQAIIVIALSILIIWIFIIANWSYHDSSILCGSNHNANMLSLVAFGSTILGLITYWLSPDSRSKIRSWAYRAPMLWSYLLDSGDSSYFNPDQFVIKHGRYQKVPNTMYKSDQFGLPIINDLSVPLNSFNYDIYKRYHANILDSSKHWQMKSDNKNRQLINEFILEKTRIKLIGNTCMIVKSRSGEHLLIHKSKYAEFLEDQWGTDSYWRALDMRRAFALKIQIDNASGVEYFAKHLANDESARLISNSAKNYYDPLIKEMATMYAFDPTTTSELTKVITMISNDTVSSYSLQSITNKLIELKLAELVKDKLNDPNKIQSVLLQDTKDTAQSLESIFSNLISESEFLTKSNPDTELIATKNALDQLAGVDSERFLSTLNTISITDNIKSPIGNNYIYPINKLPRYASDLLKFHINRYMTEYNHKHSISTQWNEFKSKHSSSIGPDVMDIQSATNIIQPNPEDVPIPDEVSEANMNATNALVMSMHQSLNTNMRTAQYLADSSIELVDTQLAKINSASSELNKMMNKLTKDVNDIGRTVASIPDAHELRPIAIQYHNGYSNALADAKILADANARQRLELEQAKVFNEQIINENKHRNAELNSLRKTVEGKSMALATMTQQAVKLAETLKSTTNALEFNKHKIESLAQQVVDIQNQSQHDIQALQELNALTQQQSQLELTAQHQFQLNAIQHEREQLNAIVHAQQERLKSISNEQEQLKSTIDQQEKLKASLENDQSNQIKTIKDQSDQLSKQSEELKQFNEKTIELISTLAEKTQQIETFEERNKKMIRSNLKLRMLAAANNEAKSKELENQIEQIKQKESEIEQSKKSLEIAHVNELTMGEVIQKKKNKDKQLKAMLLVKDKLLSNLHKRKAADMSKLSAQNQQLIQSYDKLQQANNDAQLEIQQLQLQIDAGKQLLQSSSDVENQRIKVLEQERIAIEASYALADEDKNAQIKRIVDERDAQLQRMKTEAEVYVEQISNLEKEAVVKQEQANTLQQQLIQAEATIKNFDTTVAADLSKANNEILELKKQITTNATQANVHMHEEQKYADERSREDQRVKKLEQELSTQLRLLETKLLESEAKQKANINVLRSACDNIMIELNKRSKITIKMIPPLGDTPVKIQINSRLISRLNDQINAYQAGRVIAISKDLMEILMKVIPINQAYPEYLNETNGKMITFIYSMFKAIDNHPDIIDARKSLQDCTSLHIEDFKLLDKCELFVETAESVFDDPAKLETILRVYNITKIRVNPKMPIVQDIQKVLSTYRVSTSYLPKPIPIMIERIPESLAPKKSTNLPQSTVSQSKQLGKIKLTPSNASKIIDPIFQKDILTFDKLDAAKQTQVKSKLNRLEAPLNEAEVIMGITSLNDTLDESNIDMKLTKEWLDYLIDEINSGMIASAETHAEPIELYNPQSAWA